MDQKRVLIFGVFDYFHLGHLRLFKQAKKYGDYLIVAVQDNDYIKMFKPDADILYSTEERVELVESMRMVDEVCVYCIADVSEFERIDFDVLAFGEDQVGERFDELIHWCEAHGKDVVRLKRTSGISSSDIKNRLLNK